MTIKLGKPVQSWEEHEEDKERAEQAELRPFIHRPKGSRTFTVYTGYLDPQCESDSMEASLAQ